MPSSRRPTPPSSSQPEPEYSRRETPRSRTHSTRPKKYSVAHLPRRVVHAAREDEAVNNPIVENTDDEANRQAKIKRRLRLKRRLTPWELAGFAASCVACAFLLNEIGGAQSDFRQIHNQVAEKQENFRILDKQRNDEKNRLAHLKSEKGREQLLAERGYLRPGDRILLFPFEKKLADGKTGNRKQETVLR